MEENKRKRVRVAQQVDAKCGVPLFRLQKDVQEDRVPSPSATQATADSRADRFKIKTLDLE